MKKVLFPALLFFNTSVLAQSVAINNDASLPHPSSILDIKSNVKGMLMPRSSTASILAIPSPAKGLMLYDTVTSSVKIYNGVIWIDQPTQNMVWSLNGNSNTDPLTNFIGTNDNKPLRFRMNNQKSGLIDSASANTALDINLFR